MTDKNSSSNQDSAIDAIVLGLGPSVAMASLYNTIAWNTSQSMSNAVYAQQMGFSSMLCTTALTVHKLLGK